MTPRHFGVETSSGEMNQVDISRAAALITNSVPNDQRIEWCRMISRARSLEDVAPEWREQIQAAHAERLKLDALVKGSDH